MGGTAGEGGGFCNNTKDVYEGSVKSAPPQGDQPRPLTEVGMTLSCCPSPHPGLWRHPFSSFPGGRSHSIGPPSSTTDFNKRGTSGRTMDWLWDQEG